MFSPSSGSRNSLALTTGVAGGDGAGRASGFDGAGIAVGATDFSAGALAVSALGSTIFVLAPAPFSTVKITWPTLTFSPSLTRISFTVPLTEDGTSTTALSVSNSMTGWPSLTIPPG